MSQEQPGAEDPNGDGSALPSSHGDDELHRASQGQEQPGSSSGRHVSPDPEWPLDLQGDAATDAADSAPQPDRVGQQRYSADDTPLINDPQILALIQATQHLHLPVQMPDARAARELREADPETYAFWLKTVEKRVDHDMWMEKAPFDLPNQLARRGQVAGVVGLLVLAVVAALALFFGHPWVAGIFGVLDFVGVVAAFSLGGSSDGGAHRAQDDPDSAST